MKSVYYPVFIAVLLASCSTAPSEKTVQTAIAETQAAQPTPTLLPIQTTTPTIAPTNTPIPLNELDLEPILFMPGDLPSRYELAVFYHEIPGLIFFNRMSNFPIPDAVTSMDIDDTLHINSIVGDYEKSRVSVMLYNDLVQRDVGYELLSTPGVFGDYPVNPLDNVGEKAVNINAFGSGYEYVIFTRCNALIFMQTTDDTSNYAQRLDERLSEIVCP